MLILSTPYQTACRVACASTTSSACITTSIPALPTRQISRAVNRIQKRNVSQFVNDIRISEACRLLRETPLSITQVIYESGFQTKSNFNREFLRVTGKTPRQWRGEIALK